MYEKARSQAGRAACPSVVIMDSQSVKTAERGGIRGFDAHNLAAQLSAAISGRIHAALHKGRLFTKNYR
jgi:hypothetical protein